MASKNLSRLYARLVTGSRPIEAALQTRVVTYLQRAGEFGLLGRMAARTDLVAEADALIRKINKAPVVAGWASRPGLAAADIMDRMRGETRVSTLLPLAKTTGLPEEIYDRLAAQPSTRIMDALLDNPSVSAQVRLNHIDAVARAISRKPTWDVRQSLGKYTAGDDRVLTGIIKTSTDPYVVGIALRKLSERADPALRDHVIERLETLYGTSEDGSDDDRHADGSVLLDELASGELTPAQLKKLRALAARKAKDEDRERFWRYSAPTYTSVKKNLSPKGRERAAKSAQLATCTDPARASKLFRELVPSTAKFDREAPAARAVLSAIARNRVLPAKTVMLLVDELEHDDTNRLMCSWVERGEIDAVVEVALESWSQPEWVDMLTDPANILAAIVERVTGQDGQIPAWVLHHPVLFRSPETTLAALPWHCLSKLGGFDDQDHPTISVEHTPRDIGADEETDADRMVTYAQKRIVEQLGEDPQRWETFESLADEFEGPLPDLLNAVTALG